MKSDQLTKISVAFYAPMFTSFEAQLDAAFIKRDAFLDHVLAHEIAHVKKDLKGKRNSAKARRYIGRQLRALGGEDSRSPVSLKVRKSTALALRDLEKAHNLVRDALLNRVITFLRSSDKFLDAIGLPRRVDDMRREGVEDMPTGPLRSIAESMADPFFYLRVACENRYGCGFYAMPMPVELNGLACYLPDDEVPETAAHRARKMESRKMAAILESFESNLPKAPAAKKGGRRG